METDTKRELSSWQAHQGDASSFVNHGLNNWSELRKQWKTKNPEKAIQPFTRAVNPDLLYDELVTNEREGKLSQRTPLPELISVLSEVWEADGMVM